MNQRELEDLWSATLRSNEPTLDQFERLAIAVLDVHSTGAPQFVQHVSNRLRQISEKRDGKIGSDDFDPRTAKILVADEIGFADWDDLVSAVENHTDDMPPVLFRYAVAAMERGDFSALESMVGGAERFDDQVMDWYEKGLFESEPETLWEVFSAACMLGYDKTVAYLLDKGVDPYAGMRTGLAGFHYATSSGRLNVVKALIDRQVPMEIKNMYGGTVFGQALWSAVNEYTPDHAAIIEALIDAGAGIEPGTLEWWEQQDVPSDETKMRVADALRKYGYT